MLYKKLDQLYYKYFRIPSKIISKIKINNLLLNNKIKIFLMMNFLTMKIINNLWICKIHTIQNKPPILLKLSEIKTIL